MTLVLLTFQGAVRNVACSLYNTIHRISPFILCKQCLCCRKTRPQAMFLASRNILASLLGILPKTLGERFACSPLSHARFACLLRSLRSLLLYKQQSGISPALLYHRHLTRFSNFTGNDGGLVSCCDFHSANSAIPSSLVK